MSESVAGFWKVIDRHRSLFAIPDNGKEEQMDEALDALQKIDPRLYFHIGYKDDGVDLLISAEGAYDLSEAISLIIRAAPEMPGWSLRPIVESDALDGKRNKVIFPDDENGDVLYGFAKGARDLISRRPVDFCHLFSSETSAAEFANCLSEGERSAPKRYDGRQGYGWEVIVTKEMIPSHANITMAEDRLSNLASKYGGIPEGWGFFCN